MSSKCILVLVLLFQKNPWRTPPAGTVTALSDDVEPDHVLSNKAASELEDEPEPLEAETEPFEAETGTAVM